MIAWRLAIRSAAGYRVRMRSTLLLAAASTVALVCTSGYVQRVRAFVRVGQVYTARGGHISVFAPGGQSRHLLAEPRYRIGEASHGALRAWLEGRDEVLHVAAQLRGIALAEVGGGPTHNVLAIGVELASEQFVLSQPSLNSIHPEVTRPTWGTWPPIEQDRNGVALAHRLFRVLAPGVPSESHDVQFLAPLAGGGFGALTAPLAAVITTGQEALEERLVLMPITQAQALFETPMVSSIHIFLRDASAATQFAKTLADALPSLEVAAEAFAWDGEELGRDYRDFMSFLRVLSLFMIGIIVLVVAVGIAGTSIVVLAERQRTLGTLLALGFRPSTLRLALVGETLLATTLGVATGCVVAQVVVAAVAASNIRFSPPGVSGDIQFLLLPSAMTYLWAGLPILAAAALSSWLASHPVKARSALNLLQGQA